VFARSKKERDFALELGADWAGNTRDMPPAKLDAIIDTTPAWMPVVASMAFLRPGGRLVINAIRKEEGDKDELLQLNYQEHLWLEKEIKSVANITRSDVREFLNITSRIRIRPEFTTFSLDEANQAVLELKQKTVKGSKVLVL
jgi:propanol-preferring alcohol dehydrogenase